MHVNLQQRGGGDMKKLSVLVRLLLQHPPMIGTGTHIRSQMSN